MLTAQSDEAGQAVCDFLVIPPRWSVAEHTFIPPFYHRNTHSEFMGNIAVANDTEQTGYCAGASILHSTMSGHGPETELFLAASNAPFKPMKFGDDYIPIMFETMYQLKLTNYSVDDKNIDLDYYKGWQNLPRVFNKDKKEW